MKPAIVDIAANLTHRSFRADLTEVLHRAREAGVSRQIVTGLSGPLSERAAAMASANPGELFSTAGVHPHNASSFDSATAATIRRLTKRPEVVAIGECGLDFNRDFSPRDQQRAAFEAQLAIAAETELPVYLHERDAAKAFLDVMREWRSRLSRGVVHCFTGTRETCRAYLQLDLYIGITGWICDSRRGSHLPAVVRDIPEDRLLIETDAPFLSPIRGVRRNEPANLTYVLEAVARARGEPIERVARVTSRNTERLFGLPSL